MLMRWRTSHALFILTMGLVRLDATDQGGQHPGGDERLRVAREVFLGWQPRIAPRALEMRPAFIRGAKGDAQVLEKLRGRASTRALGRIRGDRADRAEQLAPKPWHTGDVERIEAPLHDPAELTGRAVYTKVEMIWHGPRYRDHAESMSPNERPRALLNAVHRRSPCRPSLFAPFTIRAVHS